MDDNPEYREVIHSELEGNKDRHSPLAKSLIPLVFSILNAKGVAFNKWNMTEKTTILNEEEKILCIREVLLQANIQSKDIDDEFLRISLTISQLKSAIFQLGINPSERDYSSIKKGILDFLLTTS